jgi:predicted transcriptional regulator
MDRAWLAGLLAEGLSLEQIGALADRDPSTVGYWVAKHGLTPVHQERHAAKGGVERERLEALVEQRLSIREIGEELGLSRTAVRYWLKRHQLKTQAARYRIPAGTEMRPRITRPCQRHGVTEFVRRSGGGYRCLKCRSEAVSRRRRKVKQILISEAGGACAICGYSKYAGALQFHHRDRGQKAFELSLQGVTRSVDTLRAEAIKCVLLCSNCHAEVEAGYTAL